MPSAAGMRLTEAHRTAQAQISARLLARMVRIWPLLDLGNLDRSADGWLSAAEALVLADRQASAALANQYVTAYRAIEAGVDPAFLPATAADVDLEALRTSLRVTGPVRVKDALSRGLALPRASNIASAASAGAAQRCALEGGRSVITRTARTDRAAQGWARVTSGKPCAFCAMLASRGPVYGEHFQAHDHCRCSSQLVYDGNGWDPRAKQWQSLYDEVRSDLGAGANAQAIRAEFRRRYEAL